MATNHPFTFTVDVLNATLDRYDNHIERRLSSMADHYLDREAAAALLAQGDPLLYEVYEILRPHADGELPNGLSVLHPGKVGDVCKAHGMVADLQVPGSLGGEPSDVRMSPHHDDVAHSIVKPDRDVLRNDRNPARKFTVPERIQIPAIEPDLSVIPGDDPAQLV